MNSFNSLVNNNLGWVHENKLVLPILSLILGVYAALARPKLPKFMERLFENPVFRLVMISYIIYRGNNDPQLSLMIAAAFLITMHMINKQKVTKMEKMGAKPPNVPQQPAPVKSQPAKPPSGKPGKPPR